MPMAKLIFAACTTAAPPEMLTQLVIADNRRAQHRQQRAEDIAPTQTPATRQIVISVMYSGVSTVNNRNSGTVRYR